MGWLRLIFWVFIVNLIAVGAIYFYQHSQIHQNEIIMNKACEDHNLSPCYADVVLCYSNCRDIGYSYFKWEDGGFTSDNCWCKVNNESKQIW